jgi:hypothetical protein
MLPPNAASVWPSAIDQSHGRVDRPCGDRLRNGIHPMVVYRKEMMTKQLPDNIKQDFRSIQYMRDIIINIGGQDPETSEYLRNQIWQTAERIVDWENENT